MDKPLLPLVFGGEAEDRQGTDFADPDTLDILGIFPDHKTALQAWRGAGHAHVDEGNVKYVIVHLHRLLDPDQPREFHQRTGDR